MKPLVMDRVVLLDQELTATAKIAWLLLLHFGAGTDKSKLKEVAEHLQVSKEELDGIIKRLVAKDYLVLLEGTGMFLNAAPEEVLNDTARNLSGRR